MFIVRYFTNLYLFASQPQAYRYVLVWSYKRTLGFFFTSTLLTTLLLFLSLGLRDLPGFVNFLRSETANMLSQLPEDTLFVLKDHTLTVEGIETPFTINGSSAAINRGFPKNFITISGEETSSDSFLTFTPKSAFYHGVMPSNDALSFTYQEIDLPAQGTFTITDIAQGIQQLISSLPAFAAVMAVFLLPFFWLGTSIVGLLTLVILTFIMQTMAWFFGIIMPYRRVFALGLIALPVGLLLERIAQLIFGVSNVSLSLAAYVGIVLLVFMDLKKIPPAQE